MNENEFRIMGLHTRIERNKKLSSTLKVLALVCLFFSFCYCAGSVSIEHLDKSQGIITNLIWRFSRDIREGDIVCFDQ